MVASPLSPGRLLASACDRASTPRATGTGRTRRETLAVRLLEQVLLDTTARDAFSRRIAGTREHALAFRPPERGAGLHADLVAQIDGRRADVAAVPGRIAIRLRVDGALTADDVLASLETLGPADSSRLIAIVPKGGRPRIDEDTELGAALQQGRVVLTTWKALAKELTRKAKDQALTETWRFLADFCESGPDRTSRPLAPPRILLDEALVAEFRDQLSAVRLVAERLIGRAPAFSTSRRAVGARLHAGASGRTLGVEFAEVEGGTPIRAAAERPRRTQPLGIGALGDPIDREAAAERLQEIAATADWRIDPAFRTDIEGFIGAPASRTLEDARALLWEVMDPSSLARAGFPLVPRRQPVLDEERLAVRVSSPEHPMAGTFLVSIGGSRTWKTLLPRVTREFDGRTYIVQARRNDEAADLVAGVHDALRSLATKP